MVWTLREREKVITLADHFAVDKWTREDASVRFKANPFQTQAKARGEREELIGCEHNTTCTHTQSRG